MCVCVCVPVMCKAVWGRLRDKEQFWKSLTEQASDKYKEWLIITSVLILPLSLVPSLLLPIFSVCLPLFIFLAISLDQQKNGAPN